MLRGRPGDRGVFFDVNCLDAYRGGLGPSDESQQILTDFY